MDAAYAWLKKRYNESLAQALCVTNPRDDSYRRSPETIGMDDPPEPRKWYQVWR